MDASLALEPDEQTLRFRNSFGLNTKRTPGPRLTPWGILTALPSFVSPAVILAAIIVYNSQPTGYASRYQPNPAQPSASQASLPIKGGSPRSKVNEFVDQVAGAVEAHATPAGTHQEGTTTINDYELNRSKYTSSSFQQISEEIAPFLTDASANLDGFASSAYFNSRLMGLSIDVINGFNSGQDVSAYVSEVESLGQDPRVSAWLEASSYATPFVTLRTRLKKLVRNQTIGESFDAKTNRLEELKGNIQELEKRVQVARSDGDMDREHIAVAEHNRRVDEYNHLLSAAKRQHVLSQKADLAFNKCFDPNILLGKFQQVNLAKDEASVNAMPED